MVIVCATDSGYAEYAGVLLRSIAVNGDVADVGIVVLGDGLTRRDKEWLHESAGALNLSIRDVEDAVEAHLASFATTAHWSRAIYLRLLLPQLLSDVRGKALYLDADTIVNASLRPLIEMPLDGKVLAAAANTNDPDLIARVNRLAGKAPDEPNYNSGVLLIDLDRWREDGVTERCFEFLTLSPRLLFPDQDALNAVLGDSVKTLDRTWNFASAVPNNLRFEDFASARIIHFTTAMKPNMVECRHPARSLYLGHRAHTPWRDEPLMTRAPRGLRRILLDFLREFYRQQLPVRPATARDIEAANRRAQA